MQILLQKFFGHFPELRHKRLKTTLRREFAWRWRPAERVADGMHWGYKLHGILQHVDRHRLNLRESGTS